MLIFTRPGENEQLVESKFLYEFGKRGGRFPAYTPIVAGGENACILHYIENNQDLNESDLILVDAGCEYKMYASDITRTFPVGGKFSEEQLANCSSENFPPTGKVLVISDAYILYSQPASTNIKSDSFRSWLFSI